VSFQRALADSAELRAVYANPAFDLDSKITLTRQLGTRMNLSELATRMLEVLVRSNRVNDITGILQAVAEYVNTATGVAVAEVRSAKALSPDEQKELSATLSRKVGKNVELDVQTDPALLGGIVVKIGSEIWDASVAGKIQKFRASLT
jgi:F-type H+-transporting ATPase subunit delta